MLATNCSIWLAQIYRKEIALKNWWCAEKMAMHDVEAGKLGMNFQGIGKEQVRLGFIRLLGCCGRYAFYLFFLGGNLMRS